MNSEFEAESEKDVALPEFEAEQIRKTVFTEGLSVNLELVGPAGSLP